MQITDIITAPWAIVPEKFLEIQAIYATHARGETIDIAAIEARIGKPLANDDQGYVINSGVAIIPISGVIGKKMNLFSQISGGASTQLIARDIEAALSDPNVNSILLHIDSPGGTVDGTQTLADVIRAACLQKPIVAFADGLMASAAYWIGSAANEIVASSSTAQIGSIGVVTSHTDISGAESAQGIKTTEISAGKYKRLASRYAPLTEEGAALIQDQVDQIYSIFVDAVADNRGTITENVLADMADGRVFLANEARDRFMIDYIASLDATIQNMAAGLWPVRKQSAQSTQPTQASQISEPIQATNPPQTTTETGETMDIATLREKHPEIVAEIMQESIEAGAQTERDRMKACEEATLAGHEPLVNAMKFDGKSTGADVALAIVGAEKKLRTDHLNGFTENAPDPVPHAPVPTVETDAGTENLPLEDKAKAEWDASAELRKEFGSFNTFLTFKKVEDQNKES